MRDSGDEEEEEEEEVDVVVVVVAASASDGVLKRNKLKRNCGAESSILRIVHN